MYEEDQMTAWTNLGLCIEPSLYEGLRFCRDLVLPNIAFRIAIQYFNLSQNARHMVSIIIGSLLLFYNIGLFIVWPICLSVFTFSLFKFLTFYSIRSRGVIVSLATIAFIINSEALVPNPKMWQQLRGIQMIACMKMISVFIESERGFYQKDINCLEYGGYILCPANCFMGPWISFKTYNTSIQNRFIDKVRHMVLVVSFTFFSMLFLLLSNCLVPWIIADDLNRWLVAYRDAQAFRMSHYFISRLSMLSMISAGFGLANNYQLDLEITKPDLIELPRSLVQVVIYWNIPMHQWLKTYIFKTCQRYGHFTAIFATYSVSSILHGINFQLSSVLLSIGLFSYVEYNFRLKLSSALEICALANPCGQQCGHKYKSNSLLTKLINLIFTVLTLINLAYLGVMFEASFSVQESGYSYQHTLGKWENLDFFSHGFMAFLFLVYYMM